MTPAQSRFLACIRDLPMTMLRTVRADDYAKALHGAIDDEIGRRG